MDFNFALAVCSPGAAASACAVNWSSTAVGNTIGMARIVEALRGAVRIQKKLPREQCRNRLLGHGMG
jgi:hypothetical protein